MSVQPSYSPKAASNQPSQYAQQALVRFLNDMPPQVAITLNPTQLEAIQQALAARAWRQHTIDIRLTVPVFARKFYLVVLAGKEQRSTPRPSPTRPTNLASQVVIGLGMTTLGIAGLVLVLTFAHFSSWRKSRQTGPAIIPYIQNQVSCEQSGRVWEEEKCFDFSHDPTF
jgi:uncharacterized membrane protein YfcA